MHHWGNNLTTLGKKIWQLLIKPDAHLLHDPTASFLSICLPKGSEDTSKDLNTAVFQLFSRVRLVATPWTAARQASLSFTISQSLLKLMSIEWVMSSNHLILCHPLLLLPSVFPSIRVFSNESVLRIRWQSIRASALASVLPMAIRTAFLLDWLTGSPGCPRDSQESYLTS